MSIAKQFKIIRLKQEARSLYLQIHRRSDLGCGAHLTDFIRPDVPRAVERFNAVMRELATMDPEAAAVLARCGELR